VNPIIRTTVLALSVLGLAITPVAEAAKPPVKVSRAKFAVTVDGVQNTTWSTNHVAAGIGGCDGSYTAGGSEKVRFTSKARTIRAMVIPGLSAPVLSTGTGSNSRSPKLKLHGSIARDGFHNSAPGPDTGCGGSDRPQVLTKDCGTKKFAGLVTSFDYKLASRVRDTLEVSATDGDDPFQRCPSGGVSFPTLANKYDGRPMSLRMPRGELFNRKLGKIILIGRAREQKQDGEHRYVTTTKWVITLVRK
jgi:hypothetical protein